MHGGVEAARKEIARRPDRRHFRSHKGKKATRLKCSSDALDEAGFVPRQDVAERTHCDGQIEFFLERHFEDVGLNEFDARLSRLIGKVAAGDLEHSPAEINADDALAT